jgi:glycosyltransferase involved in cell wall biosynthesis
MRIVHLAAYGGSYPGSFVPMLRAVDAGARARGWSFEAVFTADAAKHPWYADLAADGVTARVAPPLSRRALSAWVEDLAAERPATSTVLHAHFTTFDLPVVAGARARADAIAVWHMHNPPEPSPVQVARGVLKFAVAGRSVDRILCVSQETADVVKRRGAPRRRVLTFPNAIDLQRFLPPAGDPERARARAALGIAADRALLVHFGWDWQRKGGDLFLAAVEILSQSKDDVLGMTVGGGEPARERIASLGLHDHARAIEPIDDVRALYAAADVFVAPSSSEGMPYAVLEALCTGTPAVVSDIPSHAVLLDTPGCVAAQRDPVALSRAIASIFDARRDGPLTVDASRLVAELDLGDWVERLLDVYAEQVAASKRG